MKVRPGVILINFKIKWETNPIMSAHKIKMTLSGNIMYLLRKIVIPKINLISAQSIHTSGAIHPVLVASICRRQEK